MKVEAEGGGWRRNLKAKAQCVGRRRQEKVNAKDQESVTHTLARADNLMYQAKASGKDQVVH